MPDLPDYYTQVIGIEAEAYSIRGGADTSKPASPEAKDVYLGTDTDRLWYCVADGAWRSYFMSARLLTANSLLYAAADYTPAALSVAASRIVGRKATGNITTLTGAEVLTLMGITASVAELNIMDGVTATKNELNLLDLAGLTAGELLVATAATTAAWQSTGVKLSAPDISGVVTAATALTMPAFTLGGTVTLNGQTFDAGADNLEVATTGAKGLFITSTQDSTVGGKFYGKHIKTTPANNDAVFRFYGQGKDDGDTIRNWGYISIMVEDVRAASNSGKIQWNTRYSNADNIAMQLSSAGQLTVDKGLTQTDGSDSISSAEQSGSRAIGTVYTNSTKFRLVVVSLEMQLNSDTGGGTSGAIAYADSATPPTTEIDHCKLQAKNTLAADIESYGNLVFFVEPNHYYKVDEEKAGEGLSPVINKWMEYDLF